MISESVWRSILTAPSSSEAIELAASFSVSTLYQSQLPWAYENLSSRSQANIRAVSRAFDLPIDGVPSDGWATWAPIADDARLSYGWEDATVDAELGILAENEHQNAADGPADTVSVTAPALEVTTTAKQIADKREETPRHGIETGKDMNALEAKKVGAIRTAEKAPSVIEMQSAEAVRNWAQQSPHTAPPSEAVTIIRKSVVPSKLFMVIVSPEDPPTLRATIVGTFSGDIGSTFASQIMKALIIPYVTTLKTPASREMMQAIVKFAELHWRTAISLYEGRGKEGGVNGAMAEVLVRVAGVLNIDAAMRSLRAFCALSWGEDGIRVLETLVGKCKEEKDIAEVIISSIERNILGLESSVRFGKLLFTIARDVPSIAESHEQEMESIIGRSKVFLAKRALKILKDNKNKAKSK